MKKFKKALSVLLAITLLATLIPSVGLVAMATDAITNLYFADNIVLDFDATKTEYTVVVPWSKANGYVLPELKWEPASADVTVTGDIDSGALTVADGTNTYTINLNKVGENMYANGGGETGNWSWSYGTGVQVTNNVGEGNYSIELRGGAYYMPDKTPELIQGNVTYLASSMVRLSDSYTGTTAIKAQAELKVQPVLQQVPLPMQRICI